MATKMTSFSVLVFVIMSVTCWVSVMSQTDCTNVLISMSPCLNYIQGNTSTPSSSCCSQLANVVKSSPVCLCQVLSNGGSLGISINQTQALALPSACKVQTPPQSQCNSSSTPSGSPSADSPSGSESKNTPSTNDGNSSNAEYSTKFTIPSVFFALVIATFLII